MTKAIFFLAPSGTNGCVHFRGRNRYLRGLLAGRRIVCGGRWCGGSRIGDGGVMAAVVMKPIKETAKRNIGSLLCARSLNTGYPEPHAIAVKRLTAQYRDRSILEPRRLVLPRSSTTPNRARLRQPHRPWTTAPGSYYERGRLSCGMPDDQLVLPPPAPTYRLI